MASSLLTPKSWPCGHDCNKLIASSCISILAWILGRRRSHKKTKCQKRNRYKHISRCPYLRNACPPSTCTPTQMEPAEPARWPVALQLQLGRPSGALVSPLGSKRRRGLGCPIPWADKAQGGHTKSCGRGPSHGSLSLAYPARPPQDARAPSCPAPRPCPLAPSPSCPVVHPVAAAARIIRPREPEPPPGRLLDSSLALPLLPPTAAARQRMAAAPWSLACSSRVSRPAGLRRTAAAPAAAPQQQLRLGCSRHGWIRQGAPPPLFFFY